VSRPSRPQRHLPGLAIRAPLPALRLLSRPRCLYGGVGFGPAITIVAHWFRARRPTPNSKPKVFACRRPRPNHGEGHETLGSKGTRRDDRNLCRLSCSASPGGRLRWVEAIGGRMFEAG